MWSRSQCHVAGPRAARLSGTTPAGRTLRGMSETPVSKVAADALAPGHPTAGMQRFEAVVLHDVWSGLAVTEPGSTSGWHHHGEHDTVAYVVRGAFRVETAAGVVQGDAGRLRARAGAHRCTARATRPTSGPRSSSSAAAPARSSWSAAAALEGLAQGSRAPRPG